MIRTARKLVIDDFNAPPVCPLVDPIQPDPELPPCQQTQRLDGPQFSPSQALAVLVNGNLTKNAYITMASAARSIGNNLYPGYSMVNSYSCGIFLGINVQLLL
ncbi:hypothetical protein QAD02_002657 [Eretmocerus hayati]|uniref:Uncharacterized protein n=1 Tax=Eretmocerus hayati TaxID=131215 RepID=A0ACC2NKH6_9HYME|nr:hypothetical protein QAD02_002657 [Eretmocerus hayati]